MGRFVARLVLGAAAGAVATWAMGKVTTFLYERESDEAREREDAARGGKTAYGVAAEKAAALVGRELSDEERERMGANIHWGIGVGAGACYGALLAASPGHSIGKALSFGAGFFLLMDEVLTVALGLTPGPAAFPWETHARGLVGHLAYGVAADATMRAMEGQAARLGFWRGEPGEA